jgi:hypothetical protein
MEKIESKIVGIIQATRNVFITKFRKENFETNIKDKGWPTCTGYAKFCKEHKYYMVPLAELCVDYAYQRNCINKNVVEDICAHFDVRLMRPLKVSLHSMCILDGQHTAMACVRRNIKEVPVILLDSNSIEEDAHLFVQFNRKINKVAPADMFKARVTEGDPTAVALDKVLKELGIVTVKGSTHAGHGIQGIPTLLDMGEQNLQRAIDCVRVVDILSSGQIMSMAVMKGVWWLYEHGVDVQKHIVRLCLNLDKTRKALSRQDAIIHTVNLKEFSMSVRTTENTPFSLGEVYGKVMLDIINKGLRTNKLKLSVDAE